MFVKAIIVPLVLILCFGGGFVVVNKPYNSLAVSGVFTLAAGLLGFGYLSGWFRLGSVLLMILGLVLISVARPKK